jgi:hypothetical protein
MLISYLGMNDFMNLYQIEENISTLVKNIDKQGFIYNLLSAYNIPKSSVTRLKKGTYNQSSVQDEIIWKNKLYFKFTNEDLHLTIESLNNKEKTKKFTPRFLIVTDYEQLLSIDTKTFETLDVEIKDLPNHFTFFLPWAGMEKVIAQTESIADIKAASRMAKLYDEIVRVNPIPKNETNQINYTHNLNIFFSRLLFCFFAEDTGVFSKAAQFSNSIASHTQSDGSDLSQYIQDVFNALNIENKSQYANHISDFPYVNGGLFATKKKAPEFNRRSRQLILECGELNWSEINPDIFGSMIQAVVRPNERDALGMHYTSVENILKLINPLFMDDLNNEFEKNFKNDQKLHNLLKRIYSIKIFDPACGSGNFLIISYKELRKLEHKILSRISDLQGSLQMRFESGVRLDNFFGIEIDDFASEVALLSLWLAKHQMNLEFEELFGIKISLIPLKESGNILCENAAIVDWEMVCFQEKEEEIFVIGNPPYLGARNQEQNQKNDIDMVLKDIKQRRSLDYISVWFYKGCNFIKKMSNSSLAFVSTNSIIQGNQVGILWPELLGELEISFAYQSFKWTNNAVGNAGVTVVIIGMRKVSNKNKFLFNNGIKNRVSKISPYLSEGKAIFVSRRSKSISKLPHMVRGNYTGECQSLILSPLEKNKLVDLYPESKIYIKRYVGSSEFINNNDRYCLWISDDNLENALKIKEIKDRIYKVKKTRLASRDKGARRLANKSHQFREFNIAKKSALIIPIVSSERRKYIPCGFVNNNVVVPNSAQVIYDPKPYIFGIVSSRLHMVWTKAVAGQLETRIRYSSSIVYNNFPVPDLSDKQKKMIENHVFEVIGVRENHSEKNLADLYDPDLMPNDLKDAHNQLDIVVELCYRTKPFRNDEERLSYLFTLYEEILEKEKEL